MDNKRGRKVSEIFSNRWDRSSISGNKIPLQNLGHKDNDCQVHESFYRHNSKIRKKAWMQMQMRKSRTLFGSIYVLEYMHVICAFIQRLWIELE